MRVKALALIVMGISAGIFYIAGTKYAEYSAKKISRELAWRRS